MHHLDIPRFKTPFSIIIITLYYTVGFLLGGCAPKPKILTQNRTPENVLRCTLENKVEFETLACLLDLKLKGKEAQFSGTIEFFYKAPGTFVFYPRSIFGVNTFKTGGEDDSLTIYFPKENQYYSGSFADLEKTKLWSWKIPLKMLLGIITGREGLMESNAKYTGKSENLFLYKFEDENWIKDYWVDASRCRLKRGQFTQKAGGEIFQIEYKNFANHDQVEIPKEVKIESRVNDYAQIKFLERRFDFSVPENKFKLRIPFDAKRVDLERRKQ